VVFDDLADIEESAMELSLRPAMTVVAAASAGIILVAAEAPLPLQDIRVPAIELSASAEPLIDLSHPLGAVIGDPGSDAAASTGSDGLLDPSGPLALDVLLDPGAVSSSLSDTLSSLITTAATIAILAGVAVTGLDAVPFALLGEAVTSVGAAITDLGGVFTPIGTAVGGLAGVPAGIAELIEATGATVTQAIVTPIYDFLIKLVSPDSDPTLPLPDLAASLDPSAVLDFSRLLPDLLAVF